MNIIKPEFNIGQIVQHKLFQYRGVIFDIDPVFAQTEEWYQQVARSKPPKNAPWYHVLPENVTYTTYVAERNLINDDAGSPINHPLIRQFFSTFDNGHYIMDKETN